MKDFRKFINDKKFEEYQITDTIKVRADFTARTLIKIAALTQENLKADEMNVKMLEIVFGKKSTDVLLNELKQEGVLALIKDIVKIISPTKEHSPS